MKWVGTKSTTAGEEFELWHNDKKLAGITFSTRTHIGRFVSNMGKRLFFFEKKGILARRAVITNEYGISMGKVEEDRPGSKKGHLEFEGKKYYYVINEDNLSEFKLYDEEMNESLLTCSFNTAVNSISKTKSLLDTKIPSLLLVLCWYAFQPKLSVQNELLSLN